MSALPSPSLAMPSRRDADYELPILYEDEGQEEMGETRPHNVVETILQMAITNHFAHRPGCEVLSDMNLYYHPRDRRAYVSPDVMVVTPPAPLPPMLRSFTLGVTGPAPVLAVEVLSRRTFQQGDLTLKPDLYAELGVSEYILIDASREFLPERLLLRQLEADGQWVDQWDQGPGVISRFGFRVLFEEDGWPRVIDEATGRRYLRPDEAEDRLTDVTDRLTDVTDRLLDAVAENARLKAEIARLSGGNSNPDTGG